jgi:SAM-dependent methyltransferase
VYEAIASLYADEERLLKAFRSGDGMGWHEHDHRLFRGTERFFRPGYRQHLISEWIPALDGVQEKLRRGANVADIGCGHGASTIIMAQAFPNSTFHGRRYHDASIAAATQAAAEAGVTDRVTFEVASAKDYPAAGYDLVCCFDCLHDMGDPVGRRRARARHPGPRRHLDDRRAVRARPRRGQPQPDRTGVLRRLDSICTPASLDQEVGLALGAQAGQAQLTTVIHQAGFTHVHRATQTPFNLILEARP